VTITAGWVTEDDLRLWLGRPGPWTTEEESTQTIVCNAVNGYIARVRPDLALLSSVAGPSGGAYIAFASQFNSAFVDPAKVADHDVVLWAALQLAVRWHEKAGSAQTSSFQELGFSPSAVDRDIAEALQIGQSHKPLVA
jgi:hypothetical protein